MRFLTVITVLFMSQGLFADGHGHSEPSFEGLISSEIFDLDGKMDMHVERRESCGGDTPKHFHPATGTLVYVCLLYTSPSPRDATLSRMPSSA